MIHLNYDGVEIAKTLGDLAVIFTMKSGHSAIDGYARPQLAVWRRKIIQILPSV